LFTSTATLGIVAGEIIVPVDHFEVTCADVILVAQLRSTFALCIHDEVQEAGAMLHMQVGRPGRVNDAELTDNTLSTDLLLLDRCLAELKRADTRAKHWQAKFIAHADENAGGAERAQGIQHFVEAFLADAKIRLASSVTYTEAPQRLQFRPAMGQLRTEHL
jgi:chemotaxis receptor (MCP) glutamine deamidase CheD